jgi:hypothetical protein
MAAVFLSDDEIAQLTQKKRRPTQRKVLNALGVSHKPRPDGTLVVLRSHVEKLLGGHIAAPAKKEPEPNWGALNGSRKKH